jgi:hypothetical protein
MENLVPEDYPDNALVVIEDSDDGELWREIARRRWGSFRKVLPTQADTDETLRRVRPSLFEG